MNGALSKVNGGTEKTPRAQQKCHKTIPTTTAIKIDEEKCV